MPGGLTGPKITQSTEAAPLPGKPFCQNPERVRHPRGAVTSFQVVSRRPSSRQRTASRTPAQTAEQAQPPAALLASFSPPPPLSAEKCAAVTVSPYTLIGPEIAPFSQGRDTATTSISSNVRGLNHPELEGLNLYLRRLRAGIIFLSHYHSPLLLCLSFSLSEVQSALTAPLGVCD